LSLYLFYSTTTAQTKIEWSDTLSTFIKQHSDITLNAVELDLTVKQPLDHKDASAGYFHQRIFLRHSGFSHPVVMLTEGYAARPDRLSELTRWLDANQIIVEHRYFGESIPDSQDYRYLDIRQAAADLHRVKSLFDEIYSGKWLATGISKGGQTSMYYKRFYPDDTDAVVCYVAPLNFSATDPRIDRFLEQVGSKECRARIQSFQNSLLLNKSFLLPLFKKYTEQQSYTFDVLGVEKAYEYCVLEYPFAFWQWQMESCDDIPDSTSSLQLIMEHFMNVSSPVYFSDDGIARYEPFFHQALNEIGYYSYNLTPFADLLEQVTDGSFAFNAPPGTKPDFNPSVMRDVSDWILEYGDNMIFIYGESDPWSASAVELNGNTNSLLITKSGGSHTTRIRDLSKRDKMMIKDKLEKWLNLRIPHYE
jgi:hypothetical protein